MTPNQANLRRNIRNAFFCEPLDTLATVLNDRIVANCSEFESGCFVELILEHEFRALDFSRKTIGQLHRIAGGLEYTCEHMPPNENPIQARHVKNALDYTVRLIGLSDDLPEYRVTEILGLR